MRCPIYCGALADFEMLAALPQGPLTARGKTLEQRLLWNEVNADARSLVDAGFGEADIEPIAELLRCELGNSPTPLHDLDALSRVLGVGHVLIKDERDRLGLGSFKALGGAMAAVRIASEHGRPARSSRRTLTLTTATAGNHGRAVARGARLAGVPCVIFVYDGVPAGQIEAIAAEGAEIRHVPGLYEDACDLCVQAALDNDWTVISDVARPGYEAIPGLIMRGYATLFSEAIARLQEPPTHVFLQAGCGGLAAAGAAYLGANTQPRPCVVTVEPDAAACLLSSVMAGEATSLPPNARTNMGRLEVYRPSTTAFEILARASHAFLTIPDQCADRAVEVLKRAGLFTTPSGAAGFAGLMAACERPDFRERLALDETSRVLVVLTERALAATP